MNSGNRDVTRRVLLGRLSLLGIGTSAFQRALADEATRANALTDVQISNAEWISGLMLSETDRSAMIRSSESLLSELALLRSVTLDPAALSCLRFDPEVGDPTIRSVAAAQRPWLRQPDTAAAAAPQPADLTDEVLPWLPIRVLASLLRGGRVTSERLVELAISRLKAADPRLLCVVTLLEESARAAAKQADAELRSGHDRGLLHGIPWRQRSAGGRWHSYHVGRPTV